MGDLVILSVCLCVDIFMIFFLITFFSPSVFLSHYIEFLNSTGVNAYKINLSFAHCSYTTIPLCYSCNRLIILNCLVRHQFYNYFYKVWIFFLTRVLGAWFLYEQQVKNVSMSIILRPMIIPFFFSNIYYW